ncbi:hypothetical protein [Chitinophaga polysaccharea]|uniref:hypothetical protein n=1 Tax=Chitinophaga polysaccharea TaxID=1293035 RepID=UPI001159E04C|nr:hypothetical protein [Chitinophaga polysaccharea]
MSNPLPYKEQLHLLRQQIPIGIRQGIQLLNQTNGDVDEARLIFEAAVIETIIQKMAVSADTARKYLAIHHYDIPQTIASINTERFTLSERILQRSKNNKEDALTLIVQSVESSSGIQREFWLPLEELAYLPPPVYCLLVMYEFLNYEDWEGFASAIYFYSGIVTIQLETLPGLEFVANHLREAKRRSDEIYQQCKGWQASEISNKVADDAEFGRHQAVFNAAKTMIINGLYSLVMEHVGVFP